MVFYIYYDGKTLIKNNDSESYAELIDSIKSHFKLGSFELKYLDHENEKINLESQDEFEWMIEELHQQNISEIELFVYDVSQSKSQSKEKIILPEKDEIEVAIPNINSIVIIGKKSNENTKDENIYKKR
jgi:hypothetical protein